MFEYVPSADSDNQVVKKAIMSCIEPYIDVNYTQVIFEKSPEVFEIVNDIVDLAHDMKAKDV